MLGVKLPHCLKLRRSLKTNARLFGSPAARRKAMVSNAASLMTAMRGGRRMVGGAFMA
jgi:hypothetical protein